MRKHDVKLRRLLKETLKGTYAVDSFACKILPHATLSTRFQHLTAKEFDLFHRMEPSNEQTWVRPMLNYSPKCWMPILL